VFRIIRAWLGEPQFLRRFDALSALGYPTAGFGGVAAGSPAEGTTSAFLWVVLPIIAVPWGYVFVNYMYKSARKIRPQTT
jgi:hypothetical protein